MINRTIGIYSLTINELYFLGVLVDSPGFIAIKDPYIGYVAEEIEEEMQKAQESVVNQGYLRLNEDGFVINSDLRRALEIISTAPKVVVAAKDQSSILIHISEDCIMKQETTSDGLILLSTLLDWDEANNHLKEFLSLPESSAAPGPAFTTNASVIEQARELIQDEGLDDPLLSCKQALVEKGIPPESAAVLAATLSGKHSTGSLVTFDRDESKLSPQGGFAWLTGDLGTWKVDLPPSEDVEIMKWTPTSSASLNQQIQTFISRT